MSNSDHDKNNNHTPAATEAEADVGKAGSDAGKNEDAAAESANARETAASQSASAQPSPTQPKPTQQSKQAQSDNSQPQPPRRRRSLWAWLIIVILLLGLAALGYWQWLQQQTLQAAEQVWQSQLVSQDNRTDRLSADMTALQQQLAEGQQALAETSQHNETLANEVADLRRRLQAITSTTNDDWKLAEAYYLTRLAGQRLVMERRPDGALALLEAADQILQDRSDPALYEVREQLADDIAALKLADLVDREGLFLALGALKGAIAELPEPTQRDYASEPGETAADAPSGETMVPKGTAPEDTASDEVAPSKPAESWQARLQHSFDSAVSGLKNLITVTHHQEPLQPAPLVERELVTTRVQLTIESAQWALLREQPTVYQQSLHNAATLLSRYYPVQPQAARIAEELTAFANRDIVQTLPEIHRSQQRLGEYLEQLHQLSAQGVAPGDQAPNSEPSASEEANP